MFSNRGAHVNNDFYDTLGERWYSDDAHAIALLRAESGLRERFLRERLHGDERVVDVGGGAGFLALPLARNGHAVTLLDRSVSSLRVAARRDTSGTLRILAADAFRLPLSDASADAVLLMDILEHVQDPAAMIAEAARILRPGGRLFFHTFNRTPAARLIAITAMEVFVPEYPRNLHVYSCFIRPPELERMCHDNGLRITELLGLRPVFDRNFFASIVRRRVLPGFRFTYTKDISIGYLGVAIRGGDSEPTEKTELTETKRTNMDPAPQ
jgi:2-polyprenyl-6-hydroxyphenyl methylase / 3-demethylubiquinone-9 3-methyltransferase